MKVLVINQHTRNHGDEAALLGLTRLLRKLGVREIAVSLNSTDIPPGSEIPKMADHMISSRLSKPIHKFLALGACFSPAFAWLLEKFSERTAELLRHIKQAEIIIVGPGGENIGAYRDWLYLSNIQLSLLHGKKIVFAGNSFGPSRSRLFDRVALRILRRCVVVAREDISFTYLRNAGIEAQLSADCALLLFNENIASSEKKSSGYAIFVPNQLYKWHPNYRDRQVELDQLIHSTFEQLLEKHHKVKILPQTFPYPSSIEDFRYLIDRFGDHRVEVISDASPEQQIELIRNAACLVGMRYHSVVFAAIASTPTVSFGYERKMQGFNKRFFEGRSYRDLSTYGATTDEIRLPEAATPLQDQVRQAAEDIENCLRKNLKGNAQ